MLETLLHTRTQPGVWITNDPISLGWSVQWCWLPLIGYHNTGSGEEQLLPLDTWRRRLFNRNYIHHISRLADKLTSGWNRAKTKPGRVTRQVLHPPAPPSTGPAQAAGLQLNTLTHSHGRGAASLFISSDWCAMKAVCLFSGVFDGNYKKEATTSTSSI